MHGEEESSHPTERGDERKGWQSEEGREGRRKRLKGEGGERELESHPILLIDISKS
jgi:hypothetical protein